MEPCPCGSDLIYEKCCGPYIEGTRQAPTAEALMRSRYTAYVKHAVDYIFDTTHPDRRKSSDKEGIREWAESTTWLNLDIREVTGGGPEDREGTVTFLAQYTDGEEEREHHEASRFKQEKGRWYFFDGKNPEAVPVVRSGPKVGRNDPCPCGSGKKYKKCCLQKSA